ncbi:MAG: Clp protease N-terminal domain-containing protein [Limisphaerales bacterium]
MTTEKYQPQLTRILQMAEIEADRDQSGHVGVEHVLIAMFQEGGNPGYNLMTDHGLTLERVRDMDWTKPAEPAA